MKPFLIAAAVPSLACAAFFLGGASEVHPSRPESRCRSSASQIVTIPAGRVLLNEDGGNHPGSSIHVPAFDIDRYEVANRQFEAFVADTGYVTEAERAGHGAVFVSPAALVGGNAGQWWKFVAGANWRHPTGPSSDISDKMDLPVVQVTFDDAAAYSRWAGRSLPTQEQWERAARGTQSGSRLPTDWAYADGKPIANTWQGVFPLQNNVDDGFAGVAPIGCFPANAFGLHDMIGNVWEWTLQSGDDGMRVIRGGSFLCALNYCANFRPAGFQAQELDLPTSHIGFRTVSSSAHSPRSGR